jgi:hypothetical protein
MAEFVDPFAKKSSGFVDPFEAKAPSETKRERVDDVEMLKEFGRGAALPVLGLAQSIPYEPIQRFATEKVKGIEEIPEYIAPGGFGGARSLGKFITSAGMYGGPTGKLIERTRGLSLPARVGTRAAGGAAIGGTTAAAIEEAPTMEQIPERKGEAAKYGAGIGALLTPSIPGVGELIQGGRRLVQRARGRPLQEAETTLRGTTEEVGEMGLTRAAEAEQKGIQQLYTQAQRREINLRDASKRFDEQAQRAKAESQTALRQVATPSNDAVLGEKIRQTAIVTETGLKEARQKAADKLKTTYFNEAKTNEKAGNFWAQSETGKEFIKFLKDIQNPANAGRYTLDEIAAARELDLALATRKVKGKAVPSEIDKIEKIIRDVKEVQRMPIAEGAKALQQQYKSKLAQKLEDSVYGYVDEVGVLKEGFAPTGRVFRNVYREMSVPLNQYESPVGKVLTQQVEGLPNVFTADITQIPASVFRSPQQIAILDAAGISPKKLEPFAAEYTANKLAKFNSAEKIDEFINSAEGAYLKEFPQVLAKAKQYQQIFARNEQKVAESTAGARALEKRAGTIAERRQAGEQRIVADTAANRTYIEGTLANIRNAPTEKVGAQANAYFRGLRERGLISQADEANYIAQVREVERTIKDQAEARKALVGLGILAAGTVGINYAAGYLTNRFLGGL